MPKLVLPSVKYKKSFLKDFLNLPDQPALPWETWGQYQNKKLMRKDFAGFIKFIKSQTKGENLPKGYVPHTVFWLIESKKFLGILVIRHRLNPFLRKIGGHIGYEIAKQAQGHGYGNYILKLGLRKAKKLGIKNALVTCDITNLRSKKVIESNGGKYKGKSPQGKGKPYKLRYWIKTS